MRRPRRFKVRLLAALLGVCCVGAVANSLRARQIAATEAREARAVHAATLVKARRLVELSMARTLIADHPRAEPDLIARLQERLHAAGLDPSCLTQVSAGEPQPASEKSADPAFTSLKRQEATLTLEGVRPGDLARFLGAWRDAEPLWVPKAIRLQRSGGRGPGGGGSGGASPKESDRYSVTLVLDNVFATPAGAAGRKEGTR